VEETEPADETAPPEEAALPGWLSGPAAVTAGLGAAAALSGTEEEAGTEELSGAETIAPEDETPYGEAAGESEPQVEPESLPEWLAGDQAEDAEAAGEKIETDEELPEWLAGTQAAGLAGAAALGAAAVFSRDEQPEEPSEGGLAGESEAKALESATGFAAQEAIEAREIAQAEVDLAGETQAETPVSEGLEIGEGVPEAFVEEEEEIPVWLQELSPPEAEGVQPEQVQPLEPAEASGEDAAEAPVAADPASLAFLSALAPEDTPGGQPEQAEEALPAGEVDSAPGWLKELAGETQPTTEGPPGEGGPDNVDTVPDWLRAISGETAAEPYADQTAPGEAGLPVEGEAPAEPAESPAGGVPDWLQAAMAVGAVEAAREGLAEGSEEDQVAEPSVIEGDTRPVKVTASPEDKASLPEAEFPSPAQEQETTAAWLESLGAEAETGIEAGEAPLEALEEGPMEPSLSEGTFAPEPVEEAQEEALPDWLRTSAAAAASAVSPEAASEDQASLAEETEEIPSGSGEGAAGTTSSLAEILAAAGAVYAAGQPSAGEEDSEVEQPVAEPEAVPEETPPVEVSEAAPGSESYEWVEEPAVPGQEFQLAEEIAPAAEQPGDELPEWLREYETVEPTPEADMEETEWFATAAATGLLDAAKLPEREPESLLDLNAASQAQLERLPGVGFILAQNIVTYREQRGPFTSLDQLELVPGITPEVLEELHRRLTLTIVPDSQLLTSEVPELAQAWQLLSAGDVSGAVSQYDQMIRQEQQLDEVIKEIQQALALYPADPSLYQALGDAFMRANRLQEALEAYDRAEDLIR
jgi:competence ComEA-like helix-hairpin-helix protein